MFGEGGLGDSTVLWCYHGEEMKQLLLRVPADLHRRLTARATRESRSVNALATEVLDAAADADRGDRRARLRAAVVSAGVQDQAADAPAVPPAQRRRTVEATRGLGAQIDRRLADERERP